MAVELAPPCQATRLLIVDPRPIYRAGLRAVLERVPGLRIVGEGATFAFGHEVDAARALDVLIVGEELPDARGVDLASDLRRRAPEIGVVLQRITAPPAEWLLIEALRAGVHALLPIDASPAEAFAAIDHARRGHHVISLADLGYPRRGDQEVFPACLRAGAWASALAEKINQSPLTPPETMLLNLLAQGVSTTDIGRLLGLNPQTVHERLTLVLQKLAEASASMRANSTAGVRPAWVATPAIPAGPVAPPSL